MIEIKNRIVRMEMVSGKELRKNPRNWREHETEQKSALSGVLQDVGIAGALIARETDDGLELIDGHMRAGDYGDVEWPVLVLDVNEDEANVLLASMDPVGEMAEANAANLDGLLRSIRGREINDNLGKLFHDIARDAGILNVAKSGKDYGRKPEPELRISPELHERQDYIVVVVDNDFDWKVLCDLLEIKSAISQKNDTKSGFQKIGIGRVITGTKLIEKLNAN